LQIFPVTSKMVLFSTTLRTVDQDTLSFIRQNAGVEVAPETLDRVHQDSVTIAQET
jgi:hypothetical protein